MAGTKLKVRSKVQASTILEVVISMIVIIAVFGIALMIFSNVTRLSLSAKKLKAEAILEDRVLMLQQSNDNIDETIVAEGFSIEQRITAYNNNSNLSNVRLTAFDENNNLIAELQKVIIHP